MAFESPSGEEYFERKLCIDVPFLNRGDVYYFEMETGHVWRKHKTEGFIGPLRSGLAGYLWLLTTNRNYMRKVKEPT